jgi:hypothetical protein
MNLILVDEPAYEFLFNKVAPLRDGPGVALEMGGGIDGMGEGPADALCMSTSCDAEA